MLLPFLALVATPPIFVAVVEPDRREARILEITASRASEIAQGSLPVAGKDAVVIAVAADRGRLVTAFRSGGKTDLWAQSVSGSSLVNPRRVPSPRDVVAMLGTGDGHFLVGDGLGAVSWILPYRRGSGMDTGAPANATVDIALSNDRAHYVALLATSSMGGDTSWSSVKVGRASESRTVQSAGGGMSGFGSLQTGALYLPSRQEVWAVNGSATALVWKVSGKKITKPARRVGLPTNGKLMCEISPSLFALWDGDGGMSLGRVSEGAWKQLGTKIEIREAAGENVVARPFRGGHGLVLAAPGVGKIWSVPLQGHRLGLPKKVWDQGRRCLIGISY